MKTSPVLPLSRRAFAFGALCSLALALQAVPSVALAQQSTSQKWAASWTSSMATRLTYTPPVGPVAPITIVGANIQPDLGFPFPNANTDGATDQTFRTILKPDLWGTTMRFRFNNAFGDRPVTFGAVKAGVQASNAKVLAGTNMTVTFNGGQKSVTVQPGQQVFSDAVSLKFLTGADDPIVQGRNLAVSYYVQGASGPMTYHPSGFKTSYITAPNSGDHTADKDIFAFQFTTTSYFFLDAVDVMAPADTVVICAFGDSITDGTHSTLNIDDRWMNTLSVRLHEAYGNHVSIVNEGISGNRVVNPISTTGAVGTSGQAAVDRLDRDVLSISGLSDVIWLEGINDIGGGRTPDQIIAGYQDVVSRLHARGIKVVGATLTPEQGVSGVDVGDVGPGQNVKRQALNGYIRASGLFDDIAEFDAATLDPNNPGNMLPQFLPNSTLTQLPLDYLHPNHAGYLDMGKVVDIRLFNPATAGK